MCNKDIPVATRIHSLHKVTKANPQMKQCVADLSIPALLITLISVYRRNTEVLCSLRERSTGPLFSVCTVCGKGIYCEVSRVLVWITRGFSNLLLGILTQSLTYSLVCERDSRVRLARSKALQKSETPSFPVMYLPGKVQPSKEQTHLSHSSAWPKAGPQGMAPLLKVFGVSGMMNFRAQGDLRTAYIEKVYP